MQMLLYLAFVEFGFFEKIFSTS